MAVPVLRQGEFLIASIQAILSDHDLKDLQNELIVKVTQFRSKGVVIDVTALDVIDSFASRTLRNITETTRLRGAEMVIVGIQPEVAFTMVQMGLNLLGSETALDLDEGLDLLKNKLSGVKTREF